MKRRELLVGVAAAALASGCATQEPNGLERVKTPPARYGSPFPLPSPTTTGTISLEKAIGKRRSLRAFGPGPLPLATIGQLLWAGQGATSPDGRRGAPSAGALYPLELYVVTPTQVVSAAPVVIVVAAVPDRTRVKYGALAEAFVQIEVGHAAQNLIPHGRRTSSPCRPIRASCT